MSEILNDLNLSPIEEKVYITLLATGQLSAPEIVEVINAKINEVESAITSLQTKKLVYTNPSIVKKYTAIYPLVSLSNKAKGSIEKIELVGDEVNTFAEKKFSALEQIIKRQKDTLQEINKSAKEEIRLSTETSSKDISTELDKLIEQTSQILNNQNQQISSMALENQTELSKHHQEITEKSGNMINSVVSEITNSLNVSEGNIVKTFDLASIKVSEATKTMENSLHTSLENNFNDYVNTINDVNEKISQTTKAYNASAKDNIGLHSQLVHSNYNSILESINSKLGGHTKETNQMLEEHIRNISQSLFEMGDDFSKVVKDRLAGIRREYDQIIESFTRNVERLFIDANSQLETVIATKIKANEEKLSTLFKLLKENMEKNVSDTKEEIKAKEIKIGNEMKTTIDTTQRKMSEINEKLTLELANSINKSKTDFTTAKNNMTGIITRAKTDVDSKVKDSRDVTITSISKEFKDKEQTFIDTSKKIIEDIKALNTFSEAKSKNFIKETEGRAKTAITQIELPAKSLLNKGKQTALTYVQNQAALLNKTIDQSLSGIEDSIVAETTEVKNQFKGFGDKFKDSNKAIERILANMEIIYQELLTKVRDTPRPSTNTTTIKGKDAVLQQMVEILNKSKSTVSLIYPNVNDIHLSALLSSNPRIRITIISDFDPFKNADIIKKLVAKENIQLKSLALGTTSKPYYAIGRDAEEGLIGTIDDSGEVVAIISNSQAFVELINSEIINAVITPKTKRVVLAENE